MAKRKIRLTLGGNTVQAPVWGKDDLHMQGTKIGCPYCSEIRKAKPLMDLIQYGLIDYDLVITVFECRACKKQFAAQYTVEHSADRENGIEVKS